MTSDRTMNIIALNQNILFKGMIIGRGFQEGTETEPFATQIGLKVYLNGRNQMPDHGTILNGENIGSIYHPYAMSGMPNTPGFLNYFFVEHEDSYAIYLNLRLDDGEEYEDLEEELKQGAEEIVAIVLKKDLPDILDADKIYWQLSFSMMVLHFNNLFENMNHWMNLPTGPLMVVSLILQ